MSRPDAALEAWLRGPVAGVSPILQPVAHALVQAREDVAGVLAGFPGNRLDVRPAGRASVRFHLHHLAGVLDRMTTYARGEALSGDQLAALAAEGAPSSETTQALAAAFEAAVDRALAQLRATPEATLADPRTVGRRHLPSTVVGLLVHAAEHTQRHVGQLLVTAAVARAGLSGSDEETGGGE